MTFVPMSAPIVTIFGGSGFIGRYITQRMARAGWRVRVAVRRPNEAIFVRTYGMVGQVEPIQTNIRNEDSVRAVTEAADAVAFAVGVLAESGRQTFTALHTEGARRVARIAAAEGVKRLVHISAIGADPQSESLYARSKAAGEADVREAFPDAVILRPSVVFGTEDQFFNRFAAMTRFLPVLPIVSPDTRFQPVYVDDVAAAAAKALTEPVEPGIYELGGPEVAAFRELMERMLRIIERRRNVVALPSRLAQVQGSALDWMQKASFGLFNNRILTRDQVRLLARDNVVSPGARGFAGLGITPTAMEAVLASYLVRHRRTGQFSSMAAGAEETP